MTCYSCSMFWHVIPVPPNAIILPLKLEGAPLADRGFRALEGAAGSSTAPQLGHTWNMLKSWLKPNFEPIYIGYFSTMIPNR